MTTDSEAPLRPTRLKQPMRPPAALLLVGIGAALSGCDEAAKAKVEAALRSAPDNDGEIVTLIPQGSAVKVNKCSHGWCQVSWNGRQGYALAKNFVLAGPPNNTTETGADGDENNQGDDGLSDD